jgi:adenylate cyclase
MSRNRQLVAIMFTDIQGYTAMMQHDEGIAIKIRERHRKIFNNTTKKFNGKILQYFGDGTLSIFTSTIDAVKCAIEMQKGFQEEPVIPVRIGIHSGDIIHSNEEIIGDGVNVASRIESLAVPGSIFISDKVYDEIKNQSSIETQPLKTFELKNVDRPIQVFAISNKGLVFPNLDEINDDSIDSKSKLKKEKRKKAKKKKENSFRWLIFTLTGLIFIAAGYFLIPKLFNAGKTLEIPDKSIAVLAFKNMSNDPSQEYFSDGLSEEILNSLVKLEGLKVAGRTSSFSFKGENTDIKDIGEKLNVSMVLEGSVRKSGNNIRINVQLIKTADGYNIWTEQFDFEFDDIFVVQEEIASKIAKMLRLTIREEIKSKPPTLNMEAYENYNKGRYLLSQDFEGTKMALEFFEKAIEGDPEFALAYAAKADAMLDGIFYGLYDWNETFPEIIRLAFKSISLDEDIAYGHKILAYVHLMYFWDWETAKNEYNKAIKLGLDDPDQFITWYNIILNKFDLAIKDAKEILKREPLSVEGHWHVGICYLYGKHYDKAIEMFRSAIELNPNYSEGYRWMGKTYSCMGKYDESLSAFSKSIELSKGQGPALADLMIMLFMSGNNEKALALFEELDVETNSANLDEVFYALKCAYLGEIDDAFMWLQKGLDIRSMGMLTIKASSEFDILKNDERFNQIIMQINFPE